MRQDQELRTRLVGAAERLPFDTEHSLERFHARRSRRVLVRRVAAVAFALGVAVLGLFVAWIARPTGSSPRQPLAPSGPIGTIAYMRASGGNASSVFAAPLGGGAPVAIGSGSFSDF